MTQVVSPSDVYVKFHANQAGPYTSDNNVVDVVLPGGAVYNLQDSYLQIYTETSTTDNPVAGRQGVYKTLLRLGANTQVTHFPNASIVKNCEVSTSMRGSVESIRRADILAQTKALVTRSRRTVQTDDYLLANNLCDPNGNIRNSPFLQTRQDGTVSSSYQEVPLPIRLGDLMESCDTMMYDGRKLGDLRFRFELNAPGGSNPKIFAEESASAADTTDTRFAGWRQFVDVPFAGAGGLATLTQATIGEVGGANPQARAVPSLGSCPWYVGQRVQVTATGIAQNAAAAPGDIDSQVIISGMSLVNGLLTLTFNTDILPAPLVVDQGYNTFIIASVPAPVTSAVTFNRIELVAKRIGNPPPTSMPIQWAWRTYHTIEDIGPTGIRPFNRQYVMEPDSDAVLITFPDAVSDVFSINQNITSYRLAINQVQTTDRDVVVGPTYADVSPLSLDRLSDLFDKMGAPIDNLTLASGDSDSRTYVGSFPATQRQTLFGCKMPQTAMSKNLSIKVNLNGNEVNRICLFQSQPRGIEY